MRVSKICAGQPFLFHVCVAIVHTVSAKTFHFRQQASYCTWKLYIHCSFEIRRETLPEVITYSCDDVIKMAAKRYTKSPLSPELIDQSQHMTYRWKGNLIC